MMGYDLMGKADITYRQLNNWCDKGWLKFKLVPGMGRGGQQREFTAAEAEVCVRMARLVAAGVYPEKAAKIARGDKAAIQRLISAVLPCAPAGALAGLVGGSTAPAARLAGRTADEGAAPGQH